MKDYLGKLKQAQTFIPQEKCFSWVSPLQKLKIVHLLTVQDP